MDVISMEHALSDYKILAVPMAYLFSEKYEERLREYVAQGGTLVLTYWSGLVDETDKCFIGGTPYGLMDVTGVRSTEIDALFDWEQTMEYRSMETAWDCRKFMSVKISANCRKFLMQKS